MKKYYKTLFILFLAYIFTVFNLSEIFGAEDSSQNSILVPDYKLIDINQISAWVTNYGSFFRHPTTGNSGFEWPAGGGVHAIYASGIWLSAKVSDSIHVAMAEYSYEFQPGKILSPGQWGNPNDPRYEVYKLITPDPVPTAALEDGCPVNYPGDQFLWCVYNDADSTKHTRMYTPPLEAEIQEWFFGYSLTGPLGNTVFGKWIIINKSLNDWDSTYITIWSDPDLGDSGDDKVGCDTTLDLAFCYNANNNDSEYGVSPPAVGYILLQGPVVPSSGDTAIFLGKYLLDYKNLSISSFIYYRGDGTAQGNPQTAPEARNYQMAHWRNGIPLTYGGSGYGGTIPTQFVFTGDPEVGSGWLDPYGADKRFLINVGPIDVAAGDTQEVVFATTIARGADNLNSVTLLKQYANIVINYYDQNLATGIEEEINTPIPSDFVLYQNYPNPFNPKTTIECSIPHAEFVTLKIYNILGEEVATLTSERLTAGKHQYDWDASNFASGIYIYKLQTDTFIRTRKMVFLK